MGILDDLRKEEGLRLEAYQDTVGVWTIGYGHTGPEVHPGLTWTLEQAEAALTADVKTATDELDRHLSWWRTLTPLRQEALTDMCFNMGINTLLEFTTFLRLLKSGDYDAAAEDLKGTKWAKQVGRRSDEVEGEIK